jgi:hypothetical protein
VKPVLATPDPPRTPKLSAEPSDGPTGAGAAGAEWLPEWLHAAVVRTRAKEANAMSEGLSLSIVCKGFS